MITLPISQLKEDLPNLANKAKKGKKKYIIIVDGDQTKVFKSGYEYECWKETEEILADPKLMRDLREAEEDIKAGRVYDWEDVKKELGWNV